MNNTLTKTLTAGLNHGMKLNFNEEIYDLSAVTTTQIGFSKNKKLRSCRFEGDLNPLPKTYLFPMSALTKEIEFGGKRFVPIVELKDLGFGDLRIIEGKLCSFVNVGLTVDDMLLLTEQLSMWHFNVFNLSPDEFIEVNETNNPYAV